MSRASFAAVRKALAAYKRDGDGAYQKFRDIVEAYCRLEFHHMRFEEAVVMPNAHKSLTAEQ